SRVRGRQRPVVQDDERLGQRLGVGHSGVFGELEYGLMQPVAVLIDGQHLTLPRRRFGSRTVEATAAILRKRYVVSARIEERKELVSRIVVSCLGALDLLADALVAPAVG